MFASCSLLSNLVLIRIVCMNSLLVGFLMTSCVHLAGTEVKLVIRHTTYTLRDASCNDSEEKHQRTKISQRCLQTNNVSPANSFPIIGRDNEVRDTS